MYSSFSEQCVPTVSCYSYCTRTPFFVRHRRGAEHGEQRTVRMFSHLLTYGTGTVLYCTVLRPPPLLLVQYQYSYLYDDCTASYRTLLQTLFSVLVRVRVEVQYSSVPYRTCFPTSTVLSCTFTKLLRYRYRTAVYGTQAPLLLVLVRVRFLKPPSSWRAPKPSKVASYWVSQWQQDISLSLAHHLSEIVLERAVC